MDTKVDTGNIKTLVTSQNHWWQRSLPITPSTFHDSLSQHICTTRRKERVQCMMELFESGKCADVTLECDGVEIKCHKHILMENSPVFKTMFTSNFKESRDSTEPVKIQSMGMKGDLLKNIIKFLYTGSITIDGDNLMTTLQFADMYDIKPLRDICGEKLLTSISANSAVAIWKILYQYQAINFLQQAKEFITSNFYVIGGAKTSSTMMKLEADELEQFLTDPLLVVPSENEVFDVIINWVTHNAEQRLALLEKLLNSCIRFQMLDAFKVARSLKLLYRNLPHPNFETLKCDVLEKVTMKYRGINSRFLPIRLNTEAVEHLVIFPIISNTLYCVVLTSLSDGRHKLHAIDLPRDKKRTIFGSQSAFNIQGGDYKHVLLQTSDNPSQISYLHEDYSSELNCYKINCRSNRVIESSQRPPFKCYRIFVTQNGHVFTFEKLETTAENSQFRIREIMDEESFETIWQSVYGLKVNNFNLMTSFQDTILIFDPSNNRVVMFDSISRKIQTQALETKRGGLVTQTAIKTDDAVITSAANLAFLIGGNMLKVIYMDRLIEKYQHEKTKDDIVAIGPSIRRYSTPQIGDIKVAGILGDQLIVCGTNECIWRATNINTLLHCHSDKLTWNTLQVDWSESPERQLNFRSINKAYTFSI